MSYSRYMPDGMYFDPSVREKIKNLKTELDEESSKEEINNEKIAKLNMSILYQGMFMNGGNYNNYRAMYPY